MDRHLFRRIVAAFSARILGTIVALGLTLVVTRGLSTEEAGVYFLMTALIAFLRPISVLGANTTGLRFIGASFAAKDFARARGYSRELLTVVASVTCLLSAFVYVAAPIAARAAWPQLDVEPALRIAALSIVPAGVSLLLSAFLQALGRPVAAAFVQATNISFGVAVGISVLSVDSAYGAMVVHLGISITNCAAALFLLHHWLPSDVRWKPDRPDLWRTALPIWTAAILATVTKWNGQILAPISISASEIAYLGAAQKIARLVTFIMVASNMVTAPMFASLHEQGRRAEFVALAQKTTRLMVVFSVIALVSIGLLASRIMGMLGDGYGEYGAILVILACGQAVNGATGSAGYMLHMTGNQKAYRNAILQSAVLSVVLSLILIPLFGLYGAAVATALGVSLQHMGAAVLVRRHLGFSIYGSGRADSLDTRSGGDGL